MNGLAKRVLGSCFGGLVPPTDGNVYILSSRIAIDTYGTIEYNAENKVVSLGGKRVEYGANGDVARIGNVKIKYHPDGRVGQIDGRNIEYDSHGRFIRV